jgi:hypothetical protein
MTEPFLSQLQTQPDAFRGVLSDEILRMREAKSNWQFGSDTISIASQYFLQTASLDPRIEIGLVNEPSLTSTWYKVPSIENAYAIGINVGLIKTLWLIATDVFGYGDESEGDPLLLGDFSKAAAERVSERVAAFLEIGFPLGNATTPSARRIPFVNALVEDAMQFLVLHEFAHILLQHDRGEVRLLRNRMVDLQIATFSIGQEHQADKLASRLHASMRRTSSQSYPGMEFAGPTLLLGVLGLFERYTRYQAAFDSPHSHPNAYERLYRLRVELATGGQDVYWSIPEGKGFRLARMNLDANPEAVKFADAIAKSLLNVLEQIEHIDALPSPFNDIFNRYSTFEITDDVKHQFWGEIARWLFLGSPKRVLGHLAEARTSTIEALRQPQSEADQTFLSKSMALIEDVLLRIKGLRDYSVQKALRQCNLT